jgi:hypothetical protein
MCKLCIVGKNYKVSTSLQIARHEAGNNRSTKCKRGVANPVLLIISPGCFDPSRILIAVPAALDAGTYELRIVTQFTGSNKTLKQPRSVTSGYHVTVG